MVTKKFRKFIFIFLILSLLTSLTACENKTSSNSILQNNNDSSEYSISDLTAFDIESIPEFSGKPYYVINDNAPFFEKKDLKKKSYEKYHKLDSLGRAGTAIANIGKDIMPDKERESIGQVKPTGWHTVRYKHIDGEYLYNRCHLIGYQLTGENANERNLITGTRFLNIKGMLPFENMVADYIKETNNHVLYRVTPVFKGENLLCSGVVMEAQSVEDKGEGIEFNVFCYNVEPGVFIDYKNGDNKLIKENISDSQKSHENKKPENYSYIGNKNTKKFHKPDCQSVKKMKEENKEYLNNKREELIDMGYSPCKNCNP